MAQIVLERLREVVRDERRKGKSPPAEERAARQHGDRVEDRRAVEPREQCRFVEVADVAEEDVQGGEREGVATSHTVRRAQSGGKSVDQRPKGAEEPGGDGLAGKGLTHPQRQGQRRFSLARGEALEGGEADCPRSFEQGGRESDGERMCRGGSPGGDDQAARSAAQRAHQTAIGGSGEATGAGAGGRFRVARGQGNDAKGVVPCDERGPCDTGRVDCGGTEPGPGWHGLPRRLIAEHAKQVAKIGDLLGAAEKLPKHRGPLGSKGPKMRRDGRWLGIGFPQRRPKNCGSREHRADCSVLPARLVTLCAGEYSRSPSSA